MDGEIDGEPDFNDMNDVLNWMKRATNNDGEYLFFHMADNPAVCMRAMAEEMKDKPDYYSSSEVSPVEACIMAYHRCVKKSHPRIN